MPRTTDWKLVRKWVRWFSKTHINGGGGFTLRFGPIDQIRTSSTVVETVVWEARLSEIHQPIVPPSMSCCTVALSLKFLGRRRWPVRHPGSWKRAQTTPGVQMTFVFESCLAFFESPKKRWPFRVLPPDPLRTFCRTLRPPRSKWLLNKSTPGYHSLVAPSPSWREWTAVWHDDDNDVGNKIDVDSIHAPSKAGQKMA